MGNNTDGVGGGESTHYLSCIFLLDDKFVLFILPKKKKNKTKENYDLLFTIYRVEFMYFKEFCPLSDS